MNKSEMKKELFNKLEILNAMVHSYQIMYFDHETIAPIKGTQERGNTLAILSNQIFNYTHQSDFVSLINEMYQVKDSYDIYVQRLLENYHSSLEKEKNITSELNLEYSKAVNDSFNHWVEAKRKNDFSLYAPYLQRVVDLLRKQIALRDHQFNTPYDALLDDYEKGSNIEKMDNFFNELKPTIISLVKQITSSKYQPREDFLNNKVKIKKQEKFSYFLMKTIGFDMKAGILQTTEHPFTTMLSEHDVRITTHYYENLFLSNVFSTIHEGGHAIYGQNEPAIFYKNFINNGATSAMHETMSRMYENMFGRNENFIHYLYPKFHTMFKKEFPNVSELELYEGVNVVHPSLIRTEADELTYCLHIIIRYEIEKDLINGKIEVKDLKDIWNKKYQEYLGVTPSNDSEGVLQDVHWSDGSFGYFPSYAIGNVYAAQIYHYMNKDIDIDKDLKNGNFKNIKKWLKSHAFNNGSLLYPDDWIIQVTGEKLNTEYYLSYLKDKYQKIYHLK